MAKECEELDIVNYDPAIPEYSQAPEPEDLVVCTDVLEHVEPEYTDAVLDDLKRCAKKYLYVTICVVPAMKSLPDGRNAHINLRTPSEWVIDLCKRFMPQAIETEKHHVKGIFAKLDD